VSLQRRLLIYLLISAPLVWGIALLVSGQRARTEVNELFDNELKQLAQQMQAVLARGDAADLRARPRPRSASAARSNTDLRDLAVAVWDAQGALLISDLDGVQIPWRAGVSGFRDEIISGEPWRVFDIASDPADGTAHIAAAQRTHERDELVVSLITSQLLPWLMVLPALLLAMTWAVRTALAPVHRLAADLKARDARDLSPINASDTPTDLAPLVRAMNGLFSRIDEAVARERRFTADAAHELRTPLAALRAQWDVLGRAGSAAERADAAAKVAGSLDRTDRLVTQMLALSKLEAQAAVRPALTEPVSWPGVVEQAVSDCLLLAERRNIELACDWPGDGSPALPMNGDPHLLTVMLRNLLDNAVRYAPRGSSVIVQMATDRLVVENVGKALSGDQLARLGERFHRPAGQEQGGSGLGVSIVQRIAAIHGLEAVFGAGADGQGMRVAVRREANAAAAGSAASV
jgi:two-component system sensor histidine kinase QseC